MFISHFEGYPISVIYLANLVVPEAVLDIFLFGLPG